MATVLQRFQSVLRQGFLLLQSCLNVFLSDMTWGLWETMHACRYWGWQKKKEKKKRSYLNINQIFRDSMLTTLEVNEHKVVFLGWMFCIQHFLSRQLPITVNKLLKKNKNKKKTSRRLQGWVLSLGLGSSVDAVSVVCFWKTCQTSLGQWKSLKGQSTYSLTSS